MSSYEKSIVQERFSHYFDELPELNLADFMVAVPTIKHREGMTLSQLNFFPFRYIFIDSSEAFLYEKEISDGWRPIFRTKPGLADTRNQILQYFKDSDCKYLIMVDDDLKYRKTIIKDDVFQTVEVSDPESIWLQELGRVVRDNIDVLSIINTQYLTAKVTESVMEDKPAVDYSGIVYSRAIFDNNYWYETKPETCEDQFMAKLLLVDPYLKCRPTIIMKRETQQNSKGTSTFGDTDGHKSWQDNTNDILEYLTLNGFTAEMMNQLWTPEHRPVRRYPLGYKRHKKYIQETPKWDKFLR